MELRIIVTGQQLLKMVSGAGGRNDSTSNASNSKGSNNSGARGNSNYNNGYVVGCNNGIIGGTIAGLAGGPVTAGLGMIGGAMARGCFTGSGNGGNQENNNSSENCNSGGMGDSCNR